jgi:hypothetical protein
MANKDLFKQAIAEAKSVREAAIANAKEALEETLTPHLKDMLAAKLQEMEDSQNEEETVNEMEEEEVEEMKHSKDKKDKVVEEDLTEVPEVAEAEEEELPAEVEPEQSDDEAGAAEGDEELGDLTVDQFKDLIRDIIAQEMGAGEEMPADDMDAGDMEEPAADMGMGDDMPGEDEEEIDLDELLRELESVSEGEKEEETMEEDVTAKSTANQESAEPEAEGTNINRTVKEDARKELKEALATIESLKKDLQEVNLLNSKLLYVNKIFKANDLNESQKVNVISAFDKAESVKEVKLVFETVSETFVTKKEATIKEQKLGMASKATGTTARKPEVITEVSDAVRRMQKLAGII